MTSTMPLNPRFCYYSISETGCRRGNGCRLRHDIVRCECGLVLPVSDHASHSQGKRHRDAIAGKGLRPRRQSPNHSYYYDDTEIDSRPTEGHFAAPTRVPRCPKCSRFISPEVLQAHINSHNTQDELDAAKQEIESNKGGITVSELGGVEFGIVGEDEEPVVRLEITRVCEQPPPPLKLTKCRMLSSMRKDAHGERFSASLIGSPYINPPRSRTLLITFHPSYAGRYEDTLELVFYDIHLRKRFVIHRKVCATVGDRADHEALQATTPYHRPKRGIPLRIDGPIKKSTRPATWTKTHWKGFLPKFEVPKQLTDVIYRGGSRRDTFELLKSLVSSAFNIETYGSRFQLMLHLEEEQMKKELDAYAMEGVTLQADYPRYKLEVNGLAEGRPSVLVGDFILVRQENATTKTWYEGRVHQVYENHVGLRFDDNFSIYRGSSFDVRFVLNRLSLRRMHAAVMNANNPRRLLFPDSEHTKHNKAVTQDQMDDIRPLFNRLIGEDPEQLQTVAAIVNLPRGSVPFVLFGPPGTGKTVTIVESIRQILSQDPNARIIACAPSNSAADLLTTHLVDLGASQLLRLNSVTRPFRDLPKPLQKFCLYNDNEVFTMPASGDAIKLFRVVVSTCLTAGVPASLGVEQGWFSHIFVDEAGQTTEPAVMVALKTLCGEKTNVILAGDNKQLGPIVHSALAAAFGLKTSYLARIMEREIYSLDAASGSDGLQAKNHRKGKDGTCGQGVTIVKLVRNFRNHPAILSFSNDTFYNRELQYHADPMLTHNLENFAELPTKRFPILFHGIVGKDQREESSPSFFNIDEATLVKKYCACLFGERKNVIKPEHVGVITPYHAQRIKILNLLYRDPKLRDIKVGSVEEFQGQERRVVIISTVRSTTDFITADITRTLGFVANPHRFNVAITRAQALLIVIGNPIVLGLDPLWRSFLNYIYNNGGWRGRHPSWNPEEPVESASAEGESQYVSSARQRAAGDAEEELARLKALISRRNEEIEDGYDVLDDLDASLNEDEDHFGFGEGKVFREDD